jgi:hypothetical protein
MIRFALRCAEGHRFESWFASGAEFDRLQAGGLLSCAVCGVTRLDKDLMAPSVSSGASAGPERDAPVSLSAPASPAEQALAELRRRVEASSEDVGRNFAVEARRIHEGEAPARPIIGEARPAEAKALIEDGVPIAPLPWGAARKAN